jgi:hypothetical protein
LYTRLVASNSFAPEYRTADEAEDDANLDGVTLLHAPSQTTTLNNSIKEFMAMCATQSILVFCNYSTNDALKGITSAN